MARPSLWIGVLTAAQLAAGPAESSTWTPLRNDRFGFHLEYPADVLRPHQSSEAGDGLLLVSRDESAKLLVGAFRNSDRHTPASYQDYVARRSYAGFPVTYAPRGQTWFVLSGERDGKIFYEKVMFSCGGGVITSFAMTYRSAERRRFDPIVERMENTFRPGTGCD